MNNRNELCRCGSGKKYKHCCLKVVTIVEQNRIVKRNKDKSFSTEICTEITEKMVQESINGR